MPNMLAYFVGVQVEPTDFTDSLRVISEHELDCGLEPARENHGVPAACSEQAVNQRDQGHDVARRDCSQI